MNQDSWILDNRWRIMLGIEPTILSKEEADAVREGYKNGSKHVMFPSGEIFSIEGIQSFKEMIKIKLEELKKERGWVCEHGHAYHPHDEDVEIFYDCIEQGTQCHKPVAFGLSEQRAMKRRELSLSEGPRLRDGNNAVLPEDMAKYTLNEGYNTLVLEAVKKEKEIDETMPHATLEDIFAKEEEKRKIEQEFKEKFAVIKNSAKQLLSPSSHPLLAEPKKILTETVEETDEAPF